MIMDQKKEIFGKKYQFAELKLNLHFYFEFTLTEREKDQGIVTTFRPVFSRMVRNYNKPPITNPGALHPSDKDANTLDPSIT